MRSAILNSFALIILMAAGLRIFVPDVPESPSASQPDPARAAPDQYEASERTAEVLWLARLVYSETKLQHEQVLVAWAARNRVETGYRGDTYREVALSPDQFSGLNPYDPHYKHNVTRTWSSEDRGWRSAVRAARAVIEAPEAMRPFSITTRHFYSPCATSAPRWAVGEKAVHIVRLRGAKSSSLKEIRFAFYDGIR
jgi:spore germination cell wall hydrolase CwlJ-like protein